MDSIALQLDQLSSPNRMKRYNACEELRLTPQLSPEAILALEKASTDPDPEVAEAARRALLVHRKERIDFINTMKAAETAPVPDAEHKLAAGHAAMLKEIRSWGFWSLGLGVMHLIGSGVFSAPWGLLLITVGLASFYFRTASMFIVYAVTLAWAALSNLTGGLGGWSIFALLQIYFAVRVFQQFRRFHKAEEEYLKAASAPSERTESPALSAERTARLFPWIGLFLGGWSVIGLLGIWAVVIIHAALYPGSATGLQLLGLLEGLAVDFGALGFAMALASLLCDYRPKIVAIIGLTAGLLTMILEYVLYFLSM